MGRQFLQKCNPWCSSIVALMFFTICNLGGSIAAQSPAADGREVPATTGKASALVDMTGYWVSIVDEDWLYRMMTPAKGDRASVPLNVEGERVTDAWDPQKDKANGDECKAYGAGNIMRIPERLHISWANDNTLQMEIDAGMQKRLFHFDGPKWQGGKLQRQGDSVAAWEKQIQRRAGNPFGGARAGKGRKVACGDDAHAARLFAEEWNPVQRECCVDRVLHGCDRVRKHLFGFDVGCHGS